MTTIMKIKIQTIKMIHLKQNQLLNLSNKLLNRLQ